jgi:hypothetical protein
MKQKLSVERRQKMKDIQDVKLTTFWVNFIDFSALLSILFIVLKIKHYINWNWWWIFSPLWMCFIIFFIVFSVILFKED